MTSPARQAGVSRRGFLLGVAAVAGGGLALTWATREPDRLAASPDILEPNAFLQVTPDGRFIFQLDKVEMGQGTMTGLLTLVAEELDVDPARFGVQFAPVRGVFQRPMQMTGQSRSMVDSWDVLRETGATARAMLLDAAALEWDVPVAELSTGDGVIVHEGTSRRAPYSEFAASAATQSPPWNVPLKDPANYRWIGTDVPRVDLHDKVTGNAVFGIDVQPAAALTAVVARIPEMGATLSGFSTAAAEQVSGVRGFVELPYGVAAVADHFWAARKAAALIELQWEPGPLAATDSDSLLAEHTAQFERSEPDYVRADGDVAPAIAAADRVVEAEYVLPYLAHATMEPLNATVHIQDDRADLWVPSQTPDMAQNIVAEIAGVPRDRVALHSTYIGGGFGRRVLWDYVLEAALIAREFSVPVKTVWTREDDIRNGYFRQQTMHRMRAGLNDDGAISGWEHTQVATPTAKVVMGPSVRTLLPESLELDTRLGIADWMTDTSIDLVAAFQAREGAEKLAYEVPDMCFVQYAHDPGVPVSIWRSVGSSYNAFVVESFIDELAAAAGADPAAYRRERLSDPRYLAVFDKVLELADWGNVPDGHAQGIAFFKSFESIVAQVAEVSLADSGDAPVRVHRYTCVIDCGRAVTPDIVKQQMESGIIFGLTAALYGELTVRQGRIQESNFHDYRMLRLADSPAIDVHVMQSELEPTGVGEPGVPPVAPAVTNALFALTGKRCRSLPLRV